MPAAPLPIAASPSPGAVPVRSSIPHLRRHVSHLRQHPFDLVPVAAILPFVQADFGKRVVGNVEYLGAVRLQIHIESQAAAFKYLAEGGDRVAQEILVKHLAPLSSRN